MTRVIPCLILAFTVLTTTLAAQAGDRPPADPADVASVDAIVAAVYDAISGPAGQKRNWNRFRSLFWPGAQMVPTSQPQSAPTARARFLTVEDYIAGSGAMIEKRGFVERELGRVEERFGRIVHAFSAYEARFAGEDDVFQRGVNSIQLMHDGTRWWVINIMWQGAGPDVEIPARYLKR